MRFRTITLGCRVNQYETEFFRTALLQSGWSEVDRNDPASADLVVVNTCSVTAESDAKSRKMISHAATESPHAEIIVMGCFASSQPQKAASYPRVSEVLTDKRKLPELLARRGWAIPSGIESFGERHRIYLKIQDGCRVGCSYCLIPKVRPYLSSRPEEEIVHEVIGLEKRGFREFVLSGIHLGHYGLDLVASDRNLHLVRLEEFLGEREKTESRNRHSLASLLRRLTALDLSVRFRLGSLEAVEVSDELLDVVAENQRVAPHFHLSMQSGDDAVLARMKRRWPSGPYIEKCAQIRERIPDVALTTDVIVGFPGETDAEFLRTCDVVEKIGFSKTHIFRYSRRPRTAAAEMPDQIPDPVKKERAAHLAKIAERLRRDYASRFVGKVVTILTEDRISQDDSVFWQGTSEFFLPVQFPSKRGSTGPATCPDEMGRLLKVRITGTRDELLIGEKIESEGK